MIILSYAKFPYGYSNGHCAWFISPTPCFALTQNQFLFVISVSLLTYSPYFNLLSMRACVYVCVYVCVCVHTLRGVTFTVQPIILMTKTNLLIHGKLSIFDHFNKHTHTHTHTHSHTQTHTHTHHTHLQTRL